MELTSMFVTFVPELMPFSLWKRTTREGTDQTHEFGRGTQTKDYGREMFGGKGGKSLTVHDMKVTPIIRAKQVEKHLSLLIRNTTCLRERFIMVGKEYKQVNLPPKRQKDTADDLLAVFASVTPNKTNRVVQLAASASCVGKWSSIGG